MRPKSTWRDLAVQALPLGVVALRLINQGEIQRRRRGLVELGLPPMQTPREMLPDLLELCGWYARIHPENAALWRRAAEYATAEAEGPAALLAEVERWGFVPDPDGVLQVPEWWSDRIIVPLEYMDYYPGRYADDRLQALGIEPARFHRIARNAADLLWMGYYIAKGALLSGGVSLLTKEVTDAALALKGRVERSPDRPLPIYVIGISEDEVAALCAPDVAVVGFNLGLSPVMEHLIRSGRVQRLAVDRGGDLPQGRLVAADTGQPVELEGGRCYVVATDAARDGLPVPDRSGVMMTNETLHHNLYPGQAAMIREMQRVALPVAGGGRAWVAGELFRVTNMRRVMISLSAQCGSPGWDAWVSLVNGIACVEELQRRQGEWADEGVALHFQVVPSGLASAPAFVHQALMCPTQTLITGYDPAA